MLLKSNDQNRSIYMEVKIMRLLIFLIAFWLRTVTTKNYWPKR